MSDEESPLRDIGKEISDYIGEGRPRNKDVEAFILERVLSHPKQATKFLMDYFRRPGNTLLPEFRHDPTSRGQLE